MDLYEKIKELAAQKNVSIRQIEEKLSFSNATIRRWKTQTPGVDKIQKVADYFGVTVDSLLGREDKINDGIKNPEIRILARQLDKEFDADQIEEFKSFAQYLRHKKFGGEKDGEL